MTSDAVAQLALPFLFLNLSAAGGILIVLLFRKFVRAQFGARLAYALWLIVPLAMAASLAPARVVEKVLPPVTAIDMPADIDFMGPAPALTPVIETAAPIDPVRIALWVWIVGMALMILWLGRSQSRFLADARAGLAGPAVVGVVRPRIITPSDFEDRFDSSEREVILTHETVHLNRNDARINALVALLRCVCWFNPLVHVAAHVLRIDQELACDAAVMERHPRAKALYANALLKTQLAARPLPLGCYWPAGTEHPLMERIAMLKKTMPGRGKRLAGAAGLALLCASAGFAAWAAKPAQERYVDKPRSAPERVIRALPGDQPKKIDQQDVSRPLEIPKPAPAPVFRGRPVEKPTPAPAPMAAPVEELAAKSLELADTARQLDEMKKKYSSLHPEYQRLERKLEDLQSQLDGKDIAKPVPAPDGFTFVPSPQPLEKPQPAPADGFEPVPAAPSPGSKPTTEFEPVEQPKPAPASANRVESLPFILVPKADQASPASLRGVVTSVQWVNPSTRIHMRDAASGKDWIIETATPNTMLRSGVTKNILKEGVAIAAQGFLPVNKTCSPDCLFYAHPQWMALDGKPIAQPAVMTFSGRRPATAAAEPVRYEQPAPPYAGWTPFAATFDAEDPMVLTGTVERFDLNGKTYSFIVRPTMLTPAKDGSARSLDKPWRVEVRLPDPSDTIRQSLLGKTVVIRGYNAKDKSCESACLMNARDVTLPNAEKILMPPPGPPPTSAAPPPPPQLEGSGPMESAYEPDPQGSPRQPAPLDAEPTDNRYDRSDGIKITGVIERVDQTNTGPVVWVRAKTAFRDGFGVRPRTEMNGPGKGMLWRVIGSGFDEIKAKDLPKLAAGSEITATGFNAADKSCAPTCRMSAKRIQFD